VSADGVSVLLDQVTEYEVVDGRELALTVLRSFGLISRNANPYREDPAGPEVPIPDAQLEGGRTFRFALYPHAGGWEAAGTVRVAEHYQQPFVVVRGTGPASDGGLIEASGLRIDGAGIVLSALRRRGDWLELRLVNESGAAQVATIHGAFDAAREVDLLGRDLREVARRPGRLDVTLVAWEILTVQLRPVAPQA
jgi:2-O-(6-phospho-alpha-D-mannosyl)-D-glycerate hydrolase